MEAATLPKKKPKLSKGKMKKTMKNILCPPDPLHWPEVTSDEAQVIKQAISKHKIEIKEFVKPHWTTIKDLPKSERPRPPKLKKVDGILFGITTCSQAIPNKSCHVIILEAEINPRFMVQHIVELCTTFSVPLICLKGLKTLSKDTFGFPTSCMAVKKDDSNVTETANFISKIAEKYDKGRISILSEPDDMELDDHDDEEKLVKDKNTVNDNLPFKYLYRKSKEARIFLPPTGSVTADLTKTFTGQDYIKVPIRKQVEKKPFKNMVVKKVANNPNRKMKRNKTGTLKQK